MNEYLKKFKELQDKSTFKGQQWFGERSRLVSEYSWSVPNEDVLTYLSEFDSIVEIGAGSGYWAHCVNSEGGNIEPYDIDPPEETWTDVKQANIYHMDEEQFAQPVLTVWPPLDGHVSTEVVERGPPHILYVGETRGGCTGDDRFFDLIEERYGLVAKIDLPSYIGIHDDFYHYVRKV